MTLSWITNLDRGIYAPSDCIAMIKDHAESARLASYDFSTGCNDVQPPSIDYIRDVVNLIAIYTPNGVGVKDSRHKLSQLHAAQMVWNAWQKYVSNQVSKQRSLGDCHTHFAKLVNDLKVLVVSGPIASRKVNDYQDVMHQKCIQVYLDSGYNHEQKAGFPNGLQYNARDSLIMIDVEEALRGALEDLGWAKNTTADLYTWMRPPDQTQLLRQFELLKPDGKSKQVGDKTGAGVKKTSTVPHEKSADDKKARRKSKEKARRKMRVQKLELPLVTRSNALTQISQALEKALDSFSI